MNMKVYTINVGLTNELKHAFLIFYYPTYD